MINFLKKLLFSSLARQLIFGVASLHAVLMTIFVFDLVDRQRSFMLSQNYQQAIGLAATLATNGSSWVLANDLVGLEEIINSQSNYPDLEYSMFIDLRGKVLGYSDRHKTGQYISDDISHKILFGDQKIKVIYESDALIDVAAPVKVNDKIIGWARVGISRVSMKNNLNLVTTKGLIYTLAAIFIGILFAWVMSRGLTTGIRKLKHAIDQISEGSRDVVCELNRHDELEDLSHDFNKMLITLKDHERKIIETHKALNLSELRVSKLLDNLRTEYVFYSHGTNGVFTYLSPSITDVLGYTNNEYLKKYNTFYTDNKINDKAMEYTNKVLQGYSVPSYEVEVLHKDGRKRIMEVTESPVKDENDQVIAVEGLARDITEVKFAADKIKLEKDNFEREQLLLESIINAIPDQIYYKNSDGYYLGSNKAFDDHIGLTKKEMINKQDSDLFTPEKAKANKLTENEIDSTGHDVHKEEVISHIGGTQYVLDTVYTNFKKENGDLLGYIQISRDVSDVRNQEIQLRRSQRLDALGKLTGGIAHDYNNILGVIIGYAELLSMTIKDEKLKEFSDQIMIAGKRAASLTKKLLAFTKRQSSISTSVNINELLQADFNMLQKTLTARVDVIYDLEEELWNVWIDSSDFHDCILNMSINAMHAMPDGGELIFRTKNVSLSHQEANRKHITEGDYVHVSISDTGCGMDDVVKEQLFDPFFTTKGDKGSGLGLSQVIGFINRSDAHINIDSEIGKGSTFNLYFKRHFSDTNIDELDSSTPVIPASKGQSILVVDDEPALTELASKMLSIQGYNVFEAGSVASAVEILEHENIDLVLSDVIMPDVDGYELATIIKNKFSDVRLILASGYTKPESQKPEHQDLTDNLLHKPYTSIELLKAVSNQLK
jgi:PAS domain S-box-containing protein